jgi:serine/threonine-protein kinase
MRASDDSEPAPHDGAADGTAERSSLSPSEELLRLDTPLTALPSAALVGTKIGHFGVLAPLGQGGMGVIYRAEDEALRREVALKVLPPSYAGDDARRRRLLHEARAAAAVNHPNIATIYEVGEADGRIYIAMELVKGRSLSQILGAGRLSLEDAIGIARQILCGLGKAHEAGLIHRDLKPDNIMITAEGVAKVLDFGLAKQRAQPSSDRDLAEMETATNMTAEGRLVGTPPYMSPEQARGVALDHRSDLFSFGVVLYQMLADRRPFTGATTADVLTAILRDQPESLAKLNPEVPPALSQLVQRCLAKEPQGRYPDCASVSSDLERIVEVGQGSYPTASAAKGATPEGGTAPTERPRRALGHRWKAGLAVGLAGLLAVAAASPLWVRRAPPPAAPIPTAPRPTAVTELPPPVSRSPDALAAYASAMQAFRDANWGLSEESLRSAIRLDPSMAAAHLRLALIIDILVSTVEGRESYARAVHGRASLSERDQVLLRALEPLLSRDPPERALAVARMRAATERYPLDAELFNLLATIARDDHEMAVRAAQRAVELDPQYADAWQAVGEQFLMLDQIDEAVHAFDRCLEISPATADCRGARARHYELLGQCTRMEDEFRRAIVSNPKAAVEWYEGRAHALHALGRPPEAVLEAFTQKWAQLPEDKRRAIELYDRARLDFDGGRFADAEARAREGMSLIQADPNARIHALYAGMLVHIYTETGRLKDAAQIADDYLKRKDVWVGASMLYGSTMHMLRTLLHAGVLSKKAFADKRAEWLGQSDKLNDTESLRLWVITFVKWIQQPEEAEEALAAFAKLPLGARSQESMRFYGAAIGQAYLLAGRVDEALPFLRREGRPCTGPANIPPDLPLGQALEQKGDLAGACAAYGAVLDRWGDGRPRSVTADKARARARALGCAERKPGSAPSSQGLSN